MPPQRLNAFPPDIQIVLGGKAALARQDLAAIVAEIIAHSADTEAQFGGVLVSLLGAQAAPAAAMFYALNNSHSQRQAVKAAMRETLGEGSEEYKILRILMRGAAVVAQTRNKLAHWCWAFSQNIPKALLFVDPEALISHDMISGQMQAPHDGRIVISPIDRERILVFFWEDLRETLELARAMSDLVSQFRFMLLPAIKDQFRESITREIWLHPLVVKLLSEGN